MFTRSRSWWQARQPLPDPPTTTNDEGFSFTSDSGEECRVRWEDVLEIRAFKFDLFTMDEVRFSFKVESGLWVDVSEDQPGFRTMVESLQSRYPSVVGWEARVIKPAFVRKETVLFRGK